MTDNQTEKGEGSEKTGEQTQVEPTPQPVREEAGHQVRVTYLEREDATPETPRVEAGNVATVEEAQRIAEEEFKRQDAEHAAELRDYVDSIDGKVTRLGQYVNQHFQRLYNALGTIDGKQGKRIRRALGVEDNAEREQTAEESGSAGAESERKPGWIRGHKKILGWAGAGLGLLVAGATAYSVLTTDRKILYDGVISDGARAVKVTYSEGEDDGSEMVVRTKDYDFTFVDTKNPARINWEDSTTDGKFAVPLDVRMEKLVVYRPGMQREFNADEVYADEKTVSGAPNKGFRRGKERFLMAIAGEVYKAGLPLVRAKIRGEYSTQMDEFYNALEGLSEGFVYERDLLRGTVKITSKATTLPSIATTAPTTSPATK